MASSVAAPGTLPTVDPAIALYERRTAADLRDHMSPTLLADLWLRRADERDDADAWAAAERAARTALERVPGHPPARVALARALGGSGRIDEARALVRGVLDETPRDVRALEAGFDLAVGAGDLRAARAYADRLLAVNEEPGTLARLAEMEARAGATDRALALLREAATGAEDLGGLATETAGYHRRAGRVLADAGRADEAAIEFRRALALNPHDAPASRALADIRRKGTR